MPTVENITINELENPIYPHSEFELLFDVLARNEGRKKITDMLDSLKETIKPYGDCPNIMRDILRLVELSFNPKSDKYYGKY